MRRRPVSRPSPTAASVSEEQRVNRQVRRCIRQPVADTRKLVHNLLGFTLSTTRILAVPTIQFTQDQARALTGVSVETIRHWRKTVPYLSAKTGKVARFSFADVVGLAVTLELVSSLGVHTGTLSTGVDALFRLLAQIAPAALDGANVLITKADATLYKDDGRGIMLSLAAPAVVVPLMPFVSQIQCRMMPVAMGPFQVPLPFPPEIVQRKA